MLLNEKEKDQIVNTVRTLKWVAILAIIFIALCLVFEPLILVAIIGVPLIIYNLVCKKQRLN
ncbi:MAG: hypothetical protein KA392_00730 [Candidatus Obscuribacter sp.]|jgi:hypothetical protein|nr:hypothetical protein [Candidatus Obscuribacter sp.]MDQ5966328.1 hypothetical protein [Cyanobacteriota bacterium erpe_2018_sw_39hr_WHONDRS-SW48-000098_B_bin.30]